MPLPDFLPVPSSVPSQPPTPSLKFLTPSPKSSSSYHTASPLFPPSEPSKICCESCGETGHLLEKCGHNYRWNLVLETYTAIPYRQEEKGYNPWKDPAVFPELKKTGKSLA